MIPSDHFVRYYNEVFKTLDSLGREHLLNYWREVAKMQKQELSQRFREGGLKACRDYWARIFQEENCLGELTLTDDYFELRMDRCPSLSKAMDNDAAPCEIYCDHCMAWIGPVMDEAGLYPVLDMQSRTEPHCLFRVFTDPQKARDFERQAKLPSRPYEDHAAKD